MATKIYLPSSGSPAVTPSSWIFPEQINPLGFAGVLSRISSTLTTKTEPTGTTNPIQRAMLRYVIGPLTSQSISGTVRMVMGCREANAGANATLAMAVKIIQPSGADRATLLAVTSSDSATSPYEFTTTLDSRRCWKADETEPPALTTQSATIGDYLVIEIGFRSATSVSRNIDLRYGDANASDLTYGDAQTDDFNPWVEFSQTIAFATNVLDNQPIYTKGRNSILNNQSIYAKGSSSTSDNQVIYTSGKDSITDNLPAYLQGRAETSNNQPIYTKGQDTSVDNQSIYLQGTPAGTDISDNQPIYLTGQSAFALRPDGDISIDDWKNELDTTPLYTSIDESTPNDADYVWHEIPQIGDYFEVSLTNPGGTVPANNHYLRWRAKRIGGTLTVTVKCELRQGASTVITSDEQVLTNTYQTFVKQLNAGEIASITDYDDLRLRFTITDLI